MAEANGDIFGPLNAETGDESEWDSVTENGTSTFSATVASLAHGSYGFEADGDGSNTAYGVYSFTWTEDGYIRFYLYLPSATTYDNWAWMPVLRVMDDGSDVMRFGVEFDGSGNVDDWYLMVEPGSVEDATNSTNLTADAWHYIDIQIVTDNSAGGARVWIDGDAGPSILSVNSSALTPDSLWLGCISDIPNGSMYFDDLIANSTGPIGAYSDEGGVSISIPALANYYRRLRG